jgi:hypothetical protein
VHGHGNAASIILDGAGAVGVQIDVDDFAITGEVLVDGIVQHFKNTVVQATLIRVPDIHTRPLPHGFEAFELVDLVHAIFLAYGGHGVFVLFGKRRVLVWHGRYIREAGKGARSVGNVSKAELRAKRNPDLEFRSMA